MFCEAMNLRYCSSSFSVTSVLAGISTKSQDVDRCNLQDSFELKLGKVIKVWLFGKAAAADSGGNFTEIVGWSILR